MRGRASAQWLQDGALAVLLAGLAVAETVVPFPSIQGAGPATVSVPVAVVTALTLTLRRRWPLATALTVLLAWPVVYLFVDIPILFWGQFVPMAVALHSVARHGRGREPWYGAAAGAFLLLMLDLNVAVMQETSEIIFHWSVFLLVWLAGFGLRRFEARARAEARRAAEAESAAREQTLAAISEERARIARELHDVVAHTLSVIVVQAGAAEQVADEPEHVRRALAAIRTTGTGALAEMRRVLAVLRTSEDESGLTPQPGLDGLPQLLAAARDGGVDATLEVTGTPRPLPAGLDLTVYRIAQEALTNVRRHSKARHARVRLDYGRAAVTLEVRDDGVGVDGDPRLGHGLIGMRERAALYGGTLETESRDGFAVRAVLPVADVGDRARAAASPVGGGQGAP